MSNYNCNFDDVTKEKFLRQSLSWLMERTNRSEGQTKFLYNILGNLNLLIELEESIKAFHIFYCPGDMAECYYLIGKLRVWKSCGWLGDTELKPVYKSKK